MLHSTVTKRGQTTLPSRVRRTLQVAPGDRLVYELWLDFATIRGHSQGGGVPGLSDEAPMIARRLIDTTLIVRYLVADKDSSPGNFHCCAAASSRSVRCRSRAKRRRNPAGHRDSRPAFFARAAAKEACCSGVGRLWSAKYTSCKSPVIFWRCFN